MSESLVEVGRNCSNRVCGKPLTAKKVATSKEYCDARCRTIAWAIRELEKEGKSVRIE